MGKFKIPASVEQIAFTGSGIRSIELRLWKKILQ